MEAARLSHASRHSPAPASAYQPQSSATCPTLGENAVGERLSDESRESAIRRAGDALIAAYTRKEAARRRYSTSSCLTDKADEDCAAMDAGRALEAMQALIRGRSDKALRKALEGRIA
jgi:hypothetical protein